MIGTYDFCSPLVWSYMLFSPFSLHSKHTDVVSANSRFDAEGSAGPAGVGWTWLISLTRDS